MHWANFTKPGTNHPWWRGFKFVKLKGYAVLQGEIIRNQWKIVDILINNKGPTDLDGHLHTTTLRLTRQRVSFLHFIYILESKPLIQNFSGRYIPAIYNLLFKNYFFIKGTGRQQESEKCQIIYTLAPEAKKMITFGKRNFICHSFIIFTVTFKCTQAYNAHGIKLDFLK